MRRRRGFFDFFIRQTDVSGDFWDLCIGENVEKKKMGGGLKVQKMIK